MKLKINELNANPFKVSINKGKLNEETIKKIQSNLKELGLMGALPVFKKEGKYYLIAGHHRVEAVKRTFGSKYEIEVTLHNYSEDNILRGMVIENLTQRADELIEVTDNLNVVREYLKKNVAVQCLNSKRKDGQDSRPQNIQDVGSIRNIADWLNQQGEVMSIGKIYAFLRVHDNLDKSLLKQAIKVAGGRTEEKNISIEDAKNLARVEKKDQIIIKDVLDETGLDYREKAKLITEYNSAPEEIKEKIKSKEIPIAEIREEVIEKQITESHNGEVKQFIPNFESRMDDFSLGVVKLEQQVSLFRKIFNNNNFTKRYRTLGSKEKVFMDRSIYDIRKRVKKCYDEVEFFVSKMEGD